MTLKTAVQISRSLRLPDGEFFPAGNKKTEIAIHHIAHAFYSNGSEDLAS